MRSACRNGAAFDRLMRVRRYICVRTGEPDFMNPPTICRLLMAVVMGQVLCAVAIPCPASAQQAVPVPWQTEGETRRRIELPPAGGGASKDSGKVVKAPPEAGKARVTLSAYLTQEGEAIDQGLVWRLYTEPAPNDPTLPKLVGTWKDATPSVQVDPGRYIVNVAYGRAHLSRRITFSGSRAVEERFVLNAGGLRVTAYLGTSEKAPDLAVSYDIYQGDADQLGGRGKVAGGVRAGVIVRLNAGLYHIVSTMGDANATLSADVTVEAGKLTDAVASHYAARVSLKLVTRAGGDAQADTQWAIHTLQGDLVRETQGAFPTHILAAGQYMATARHGGRLYQRQFTIAAGEAAEVEILMQ